MDVGSGDAVFARDRGVAGLVPTRTEACVLHYLRNRGAAFLSAGGSEAAGGRRPAEGGDGGVGGLSGAHQEVHADSRWWRAQQSLRRAHIYICVDGFVGAPGVNTVVATHRLRSIC